MLFVLLSIILKAEKNKRNNTRKRQRIVHVHVQTDRTRK